MRSTPPGNPGPDLLLSDPNAADGTLRLAFVRWGGRTVFARLFQAGALRVFRPGPASAEPANLVLVNTSGGIVGGDALQVAVRLGAGAAVVITSQAAEKVYRSAGADATVDVRLDLADAAWLEWLPQETILFEGARLRRSLQVDLAGKARLLAAEMLVFGRRARGERFGTGALHDRWAVRIERRPVWIDALRLAPDPGALLQAPYGFDGAGALATCIYVAPDSEDRLGLARALCEQPRARSGVTCIGPVLVVRWLGEDPGAVRHALQAFCARFRHAVAGLPERLPAIWST